MFTEQELAKMRETLQDSREIAYEREGPLTVCPCCGGKPDNDTSYSCIACWRSFTSHACVSIEETYRRDGISITRDQVYALGLRLRAEGKMPARPGIDPRTTFTPVHASSPCNDCGASPCDCVRNIWGYYQQHSDGKSSLQAGYCARDAALMFREENERLYPHSGKRGPVQRKSEPNPFEEKALENEKCWGVQHKRGWVQAGRYVQKILCKTPAENDSRRPFVGTLGEARRYADFMAAEHMGEAYSVVRFDETTTSEVKAESVGDIASIAKEQKGTGPCFCGSVRDHDGTCTHVYTFGHHRGKDCCMEACRETARGKLKDFAARLCDELSLARLLFETDPRLSGILARHGDYKLREPDGSWIYCESKRREAIDLFWDKHIPLRAECEARARDILVYLRKDQVVEP